jgi:hypothetical protein
VRGAGEDELREALDTAQIELLNLQTQAMMQQMPNPCVSVRCARWWPASTRNCIRASKLRLKSQTAGLISTSECGCTRVV